MTYALSKSERSHDILNPPIPVLLLQYSEKEDSDLDWQEHGSPRLERENT